MSSSHAQNLQRTYRDVARGYEEKHHNDVQVVLTEYFRHLLKSSAHILDLGCGNGRDSKWFTDHGLEVTLFDLSPELLALARQRLPTSRIVQGDMTALPFVPHSFDGVWANASLLHLTKQEMKEVIRKIFTILKDQGVFFCSVKEGEGEKEVSEDKYGKPMVRFFSFYSFSELKELVQLAGFEILEATLVDSKSGQKWVQIFAKKG